MQKVRLLEHIPIKLNPVASRDCNLEMLQEFGDLLFIRFDLLFEEDHHEFINF